MVYYVACEIFSYYFFPVINVAVSNRQNDVGHKSCVVSSIVHGLDSWNSEYFRVTYRLTLLHRRFKKSRTTKTKGCLPGTMQAADRSTSWCVPLLTQTTQNVKDDKWLPQASVLTITISRAEPVSDELPLLSNTLAEADTSNRPWQRKQIATSISRLSLASNLPTGMSHRIPSWMTCSRGSMFTSNVKTRVVSMCCDQTSFCYHEGTCLLVRFVTLICR